MTADIALFFQTLRPLIRNTTWAVQCCYSLADNPVIVYEGVMRGRKKPDGSPARGGISGDGENEGLGAEIGVTMLSDDEINQ